jgi:hypothetical protein
VRSKGSWFADRAKSTTAIAIAIVALLSLGTAVAGKKLIDGKSIKNNSIPGKKIRKHTITGKQIRKHSIPLSALKKVPVGAPGAKGDSGAPGLTGTEGPPGPTAFTEVISIGGEIGNVPAGEELVFLGEPAETVFLDGDRGIVTASAAIGPAAGEIDDTENFRFGICYQIQGEEIAPFYTTEAAEEEGLFGVSPVIIERATVSASTAFYASGEAGEGFAAAMGPCLLNDTGTELDDNDRVSGVLEVAAA